MATPPAIPGLGCLFCELNWVGSKPEWERVPLSGNSVSSVFMCKTTGSRGDWRLEGC